VKNPPRSLLFPFLFSIFSRWTLILSPFFFHSLFHFCGRNPFTRVVFWAVVFLILLRWTGLFFPFSLLNFSVELFFFFLLPITSVAWNLFPSLPRASCRWARPASFSPPPEIGEEYLAPPLLSSFSPLRASSFRSARHHHGFRRLSFFAPFLSFLS